jgi:hypothetical protein
MFSFSMTAAAVAALRPGVDVYKTFYGSNLLIFTISWSVFHGRPYQPNLLFLGNARSLT